MVQGWLPAPEPDLLPAVVRVHWTSTAMQVEAELHDNDMFNPAQNFNDVAYTLGDVFEIFLRPENQDAYYEIHITPTNQVLQLRFPNAQTIRQLRAEPGKDVIGEFKVWQPRITSSVRVDAPGRKWFVSATIPFSMVVEKGPMKPGMRWFCSFCRYDYTRSPAKCVLSSTSRHAKCDYHRQEEWTPITFEL